MTQYNDLTSTVADLDHTVVIEALSRNDCNVTDTARDLGVPVSDLRRLMWANQKLQDEAFEVVEARLDIAEKNVLEDLRSEDRRLRAAASYFVLRNTGRAKRRGWITSASSGVDLNIQAGNGVQQFTFSWRSTPPKIEGDDTPAGAADGKFIEGELAEKPAEP